MTKDAADDAADNVTVDSVGEKRPVGRPATGRAKTSAQRQKELRERRKEQGLVPLTIFVPEAMMTALDNFVRFKDLDKDTVVQRCIQRELMRKR